MNKNRTRRRATDDDIRRIIGRAPTSEWTAPEKKLTALECQIENRVDMRWAAEQLRGRRAQSHQREHRSTMEVLIAGDYRRVRAGANTILSHPKLGECFVDAGTLTYLHLDRDQIPINDLEPLQKLAVSSKLTLEKSGEAEIATVQIRGSVRIDWVLTLDKTPHLQPYARTLLEFLVAESAALEARGLPLRDIARQGAPSRVEIWLVDAKEKRTKRVAERLIRNMKVVEVDGRAFAISQEYRDRRKSTVTEKKEWHSVPNTGMKPRKTARTAAEPRTLTAAMTVREEPDIELPQCVFTTTDLVAASESRQIFFEHARQFINLMASRLGRFEGTRTSPNDTTVTLTIDWLAQLQAFHDSTVSGDALFCLVRHPPSEDDPIGGTGLLDRLAAGTAEAMLEGAQDPLPLGGEDHPLELSEDLIQALESIVEDEEIRQRDRWQSLTAEQQTELREAIVEQQLGRIEEVIPGDSGELAFPDAGFDLVRARLQMESIAVDFGQQLSNPKQDTVLGELDITALDNGTHPGVHVTFSVPSFEVELTLTRWPGGAFWITAGGVLVAGGIVSLVAGPALVTLLMGMGPLGLVLLLDLIGPLAFASAVLLTAVVTFLVWDVASVRVSMTDVEFSASIHPEVTETNRDGFEIAPVAGAYDLDGTIEVAYSSQVPTGFHQVLGWITAAAINCFDLARSTVAGQFAARLVDLVSLPHFRLPVPFASMWETVEQMVNIPVPIETRALKHERINSATEGEKLNRISAMAQTRPVLAPRQQGLYTTQVDIMIWSRLEALMDQLESQGSVYLGYAFSQNLLNAYAHAQWATGTFNVDYGNETQDAHEWAAAALLKESGCPEETQFVHVWAAACPRVLVTPSAFWREERHPYLVAEFPDVRLCISCAKKEAEWALELRFAVRTIAHLGFGTALDATGSLSLFSRSQSFVDIYYDRGNESLQIQPTDVRAIAGAGEIELTLQSMSDEERFGVLQSFEDLIRDAARQLLRRRRSNPIRFAVEGRFDQQLYDSVIRANLVADQTTLYAVIFHPFGGSHSFLPSLDAEGQIQDPLIDLNNENCQFIRDLMQSLNIER